MEFLKKVKSAFVSCGKAISRGWRASWDFLEDKSADIQEIYDVRDFKSCSQYSIWFAILSIVFGFFKLSINMETMRVSVGFQLFSHVGIAFILVGLLCLIGGTLTTTNAGLCFIVGAMLFPFAGEIVHLFVDTVTGNFVSYIVANWFFFVVYGLIATAYILMTLRIIPVKYARIGVIAVCGVAIVYSIVSAFLLWPPFYGEMFETYKTESGTYNFLFVSDIIRMIVMMLSLGTATLTIFPYGEGPKDKSKVVLKEEKEEF